jgi:thymidine kinase
MNSNDKAGRLEVICGSMFSGKTEELMRRLKRAEYAKQSVLTIKHFIDQRAHQNYDCIFSHEGRQRKACLVGNDAASVTQLNELVDEGTGVVGIDEGHFFKPNIVPAVQQLVQRGKRVLVAGLDLDFRGEPFEVMSQLMALADDVLKLKAICVCCGQDAHHTQRLVNGQPAHYDDPIIMVGAEECYEARCRCCFRVERTVHARVVPAAECALEDIV